MDNQVKFCANLSMMFTEFGPLPKRFAAAKAAGFRAVELGFPYDTPLEELMAAKQETGLEIILLNAHPGDVNKGNFGFSAIPGRELEFEETMKTTLLYAEALQPKKVHFIAGIYSKDDEESKTELYLTTFVNNMKTVTPALKKLGIVGVTEPLCRNFKPNYFMNSLTLAKEVVRRVDSPNLKIQWDSFHIQQISGNLFRTLEELSSENLLGHIQISQVPHRDEPDSEGEINFGALIRKILELGYTDWIGAEYTPAKGTMEGLSWIEKLGFRL